MHLILGTLYTHNTGFKFLWVSMVTHEIKYIVSNNKVWYY